jgi:hypothetical protein
VFLFFANKNNENNIGLCLHMIEVAASEVRGTKGKRARVRTQNVRGLVECGGTQGEGFASMWRHKGEGFASMWRHKGEGFASMWQHKGEGFASMWQHKGEGFC